MANFKIVDYGFQIQNGGGFYILQFQTPDGALHWTKWGTVSIVELGAVATILSQPMALYDPEKAMITAGPTRRQGLAPADGHGLPQMDLA